MWIVDNYDDNFMDNCVDKLVDKVPYSSIDI